MNLLSVIAESISSLSKNKVRTGLSMLGIVIGVASVIAMVAVGEGARQKVEAEIKAMGDDWLMVFFWGQQRGGVRKAMGTPPNQAIDDAAAIETECAGVRAATPTNRMGMQVISEFGNYNTQLLGAEPCFFDIRHWEAEVGRTFNEDDNGLRAKVCCVGKTAAKELFGGLNPVGQTIRANRVAFEVVGLLESKGFSSEGRDNDDVIIFPWLSFQRLIAGDEIAQSILLGGKADVPLSDVKQQVRMLLRQRHRLPDEEDDDFRIFDRALTAQANAASTRTFNLLLMTIASISLLVGGVGIMNIMLVSVTERTREIGLRMAIGANGFHILGQFLTEAVVMCVIGGLLGFGLGAGASQYFKWQYDWNPIISYWMAGVAIAFATGVGLFFGFYPAWRASRLDPITALRFE
ncbi:Macrolide export ATP-binding/permease protein MacB [Phycisphaerae bacterium RAS1]|nr:Macrolide export ATP-binding/permease protein MacB [Phycisphaerae bacterium RAS1]